MNKTKEQLREEIKHLLKVYGDALHQEWFDEPVEMIIHKDAVFDSIFEVIEKALSQKEEEVRKEVEKLKKFNLPISESGRVPIKYRYWNKGYNQAIEDVLQSLTK